MAAAAIPSASGHDWFFVLRLEPNHKGVTGWLGHLAQNGCEMAQRRLAHGCEMALRRLAHHPVFGVFGVW